MSFSHSYFDWIDLYDKNQCEWAKRYLVKNQFSIDSHKPLDTQIESIISNFNKRYSSDEHATLIMKKMKAAWNQKENRSKNKGRKAYSFVMDTKIAAKLKEISGDYPLYQTLEDLIEQGFVLNKNEALLVKIEAKQKKLDSTFEKAHRSSNANQRRLQDQLKYQKEVAKLRLDLIKALFFDKCRTEIILERHSLKMEQLSEEEEKLAEQNQALRIKRYEDKLKADMVIFNELNYPFSKSEN